MFSLDHRNLFNPFELGIQVTPISVENALKEGEYSAALKMALQLNQSEMIENVLLCTPVAQSKFMLFRTSFRNIDNFQKLKFVFVILKIS